MARKTIRVAVWEYRTDEGKRRLAYFGDTVELPESEIERGTLAGVFDQPEPPEPPTEQNEDGDEPETVVDVKERTADQPRKPRVTATAEKWVAYAKTIPGIDHDSLDGMEKDEIIALVDAADEK